MAVIRIAEFDLWRSGYGLAIVRVLAAGTTDLADIFTDEGMTEAAANPQTLAERVVDGVSYGKFSAPLYVGAAYELLINSIDETGITRPGLTTLDSEDASEATVTVSGGSEAIALEDHLARRIDVRDYGDFVIVGGPGASTATNQASLVDAIDAASAAGGGYVEVPDGTYGVTGGFTVPQGVVVRGGGRVATTLQSSLAGSVAIIGGTRAGFSRLTLDGVTLVSNSVGLYAAGKDEIVLDDVEIKRFDTGIYRKGGTRANWRELYISNCNSGAKLHGDLASSAGAALSFNRWTGGKVELCGTFGTELKYIDAACEHQLIDSVTFDTNTGTAVKVTGARASEFRRCKWTGNTVNLAVADATPATTSNTVQGLEVTDGSISSGTITLTNTLTDVAFRRMQFSGVTATLTSPSHNVHVEDCRETTVSIAGDATAWRRHGSGLHNAAAVTTTDATPTKAWATTLDPGQHIRIEAKVIARRRNGTDYYSAHKGFTARRPGSSLAYELQTGNFTAGNTITGATSGATAIIAADSDGGTTGTLTLYNIVGAFVDDEIISDGAGGSATVNGTLVAQNVVMLTYVDLPYDGQTVNFAAGRTVTGGTSGATAIIVSDSDSGATGTLTLKNIHGDFVDNEALTDSGGGAAVVNGTTGASATALASSIIAPRDNSAGYSGYFIGNSGQVECRVTGAAGHTVDWIADVELVTYP